MRHFGQLAAADRRRLFACEPGEVSVDTDAATLAVALGATLYLPGDRRHLADDLERMAARGVVSAVVCLEDAIADGDVAAAQSNVAVQLRLLAARPPCKAAERPLVFVRVRRSEQIPAIVAALGDAADVLSGFVLPKFTDLAGAAFLDAITDAANFSGVRLLGMPVLESAEVIHLEHRTETLIALRSLLAKHREHVLAVRVGATDLCALYGVRRDQGLTIYDVHVVAEAIADIVNVLGRVDDTGYVVTGPVWEYYSRGPRLFRPRLRQTPFEPYGAAALCQSFISGDIEGLLREVVLDKANGLTGKTVIHPSHVAAVEALMVVTAEEYADATDIVRADSAGGGVCASRFGNKMNEARPHRAWADRILCRAAVFGVAREGVGVVDLLIAGAA